MVDTEFREGVSETLDIINHMNKVYYDKIPKSFINFLEKNRAFNYNPNFDYSLSLDELNLKEKTKNILACVYLNYWCTPEEKVKYSNKLNENERINQEQLRNSYNNDVFYNGNYPQNSNPLNSENMQNIKKNVTEQSLVVVSKAKTWINEIIEKIKVLIQKYKK